jgi:hypothetical protein
MGASTRQEWKIHHVAMIVKVKLGSRVCGGDHQWLHSLLSSQIRDAEMKKMGSRQNKTGGLWLFSFFLTGS